MIKGCIKIKICITAFKLRGFLYFKTAASTRSKRFKLKQFVLSLGNFLLVTVSKSLTIPLKYLLKCQRLLKGELHSNYIFLHFALIGLEWDSITLFTKMNFFFFQNSHFNTICTRYIYGLLFINMNIF